MCVMKNSNQRCYLSSARPHISTVKIVLLFSSFSGAIVLFLFHFEISTRQLKVVPALYIHLSFKSTSQEVICTEFTKNCREEEPRISKENKGTVKDKLTWDKDSFCHKMIVNTYHERIGVCGRELTPRDQIKCHGNKYTNHTARCSFENLAINISGMKEVIYSDTLWRAPHNKAVFLLKSTSNTLCSSPSTDDLRNRTDSDSITVRVTEELLKTPQYEPSVCDVWINKTTLFHVSNGIHIYFRFLSLYNIHQTLLDYGSKEGDYQVLRIGFLRDDYRFPDFDRALFPGALTLEDFPDNVTVCFRKAVLVPRSYQSVPFRCKMDPELHQMCFECNGRGLTDLSLITFRQRVLSACNITDSKSSSNRTLLFISRKAYKRRKKDNPMKFQRILTNENELIAGIHRALPDVTVKVVHMEDLSVCQQVRLAVEADVILGVHGAGLVHFWWLRDHATGIELEPEYQVSNPSFEMLTTLAGRRYVKNKSVRSDKHKWVAVHDIDYVLKEIKKYL